MTTKERIINGTVSTVMVGVSTRVPIAGAAINLGLAAVNGISILSNSQLSALERTADIGRLLGKTAIGAGTTVINGAYGAEIGTVIAPGVGTLIGGFLGAAFGGFIGTLIGS